MKLSVIHETRYEYAYVVEQAHHIAYLKPISTQQQQVLSHEISIKPNPSSLAHSLDSYGQARVYFELATPHSELVVTAASVVITPILPPSMAGRLDRVTVPESMVWGAVAEHMQYSGGQTFDAAREFAQSSPLAPVHASFAKYASTTGGNSMPVFELAKALCHRIYTEFEYSPEATDVSTPPQQALSLKKGVCQDFAQVMIAGLRSLGLAARYVSGYLLTQPPPGKPRLIGADASHAWVSVYCPTAGWLDFDPTNDCLAGESHVTLAYGRDYSDVPPLRGVIRGGGSHELSVAVTVMPLDDIAQVATSAMSQSQTQSQVLSLSQLQKQ